MEKYITFENFKWFFSTVSFVFGFVQFLRKKQLKDLIALEAVELHNNIAYALGATDTALTAMSNGASAGDCVGRAQGICQAVLNESAKLYCILKDTRQDDIDEMVASGQLKAQYKDIYYTFSRSRRGVFTLFCKKFIRVFN